MILTEKEVKSFAAVLTSYGRAMKYTSSDTEKTGYLAVFNALSKEIKNNGYTIIAKYPKAGVTFTAEKIKEETR